VGLQQQQEEVVVVVVVVVVVDQELGHKRQGKHPIFLSLGFHPSTILILVGTE